MWIVFLGVNGFVGLFSWTATMLLPSWRFAFRFPANRWGAPMVGPLAAMATLLGIYMIDCLLNAFPNLIYIVAGGGLASISPSFLRSRGREISTARSLVLDDQEAVKPALPAAAGATTLADHYIGLARTLKSQGDPEKAKVMWSHALELLNQLNVASAIDPAIQKSRADCANDFAWFLINDPTPGVNDPLLAVELAKSATEANPKCATYWNTLGAAFYRSGEPESAIAAFEQSITLSEGGTAFDYAFLALSHAQLGRQDEARSWLAQADHWLAESNTRYPELAKLRDQAHAYLQTSDIVKPGNTPALP
jgi:tetratricopeptide (TPR) repeat protein